MLALECDNRSRALDCVANNYKPLTAIATWRLIGKNYFDQFPFQEMALIDIAFGSFGAGVKLSKFLVRQN